MGSVGNSNPWAPNAVFKDCSQGICSVYCPQWCYIIYSPPPPPSVILGDDVTDDDDPSGFQFSPLVVAVIGILASTFILVTYYTVISRFCRHRGPGSRLGHEDGGDASNNESARSSSSPPPPSGLDEAQIKSIGVCKYVRGAGLVEGSDCSVCLSEFQENESLRLLPKCNHAFHLPCIDAWLKSQSSCPLCRSVVNSSPDRRDAAAALTEAPPPPSVNINSLEYRQRSDAVVVVIQSSEQRVVVDFGAEGQAKGPIEGGAGCESNTSQRRVSVVADILSHSEANV